MSEIDIYCKEHLDGKNNGSLVNKFFNELKFLYTKLLDCTLYEELDSAYFPELWTTCYSDPEKIQQAKDNINKIKSGERYLFFESYDLEAIKEIKNYDYISFFEAALLIGYRVENNPRMLLSNLPSMFLDATLKKEIYPRDPITHIPYTELYESPLFYAGGLIGFAKSPPDLNWQLTLKETAEFAILKGYPENLFIDLLTDIKADNEYPIENQDKPISESEHDNDENAPNKFTSKKLQTLNEAAIKFWGNAEPNEKDTHPLKDDITNWLIKNEFTKNMANAGYTIIKPEWGSIGRRPSKE